MIGPDEKLLKLVAALGVVRDKFDAGDDDWRHALLQVFRGYCVDLGIQTELTDPITKLLFETGNDIEYGRRKASGKLGKTMPLGRALTMAMAAACITVLYERRDFQSVDKAEDEVAKVTGFRAKKLRSFRDNLLSYNYSEELQANYNKFVDQRRAQPWSVMKVALKGLSKIS